MKKVRQACVILLAFTGFLSPGLASANASHAAQAALEQTRADLGSSGRSNAGNNPGNGPARKPWISGVIDSTGEGNVGSATLEWITSSWSSCDARTKSCGTSRGNRTRTVKCRANGLDGGFDFVNLSFCDTVASTIGSRPEASKSCSRSFGSCSPPSPPRSSGGSGGCSASATVCGLYSSLLGRSPDPDGAAYWQAKIDSGTSVDDVRSHMYNSVGASSGTGGNQNRDCSYLSNRPPLC